jgi:Fanconi anemia group M protein
MSYIFFDKIEKREYQENIFNTAKNHNTLIVLPTGLGKTMIAMMIIDWDLSLFPGAKALFLAPTKPLILQHQKTFNQLSSFKSMISDGEIPKELRQRIYETGDVIFATPQTIQNDIENKIIDLSKFSTLVVDEAHHAVGNYPYVSIARSFMALSFHKHVVALTASPSSDIDRIREICRNLFINRIEVRTEEDPDVSPYVFKKDVIKVAVELSPEVKELLEKIQELKERIIQSLQELGIEQPKSKLKGKLLVTLQKELIEKAKQDPSLFSAIFEIAKLMKLEHLEYMLSTQTYKAALDFAIGIMNSKKRVDKQLARDEAFKAIEEELSYIVKSGEENPKIKKLLDIVSAYAGSRIIVFAQYKYTVRSLYEALKILPNVRPAIFVGHGKGGITRKEQEEIIKKFESGEVNVLLSTSVSEEGISIRGADVAVFYEPVPSAIRSVQRKGRVGRFNFGTVFILIAKDTKDEGYYWVSAKKERKLKHLLQYIGQELMKDKSLLDFG